MAHLTAEQYLEIERKNEFKSEYRDGEMIAMPPINRWHDSINVRLMCLVYEHLKGTTFEAFTSKMRVSVRPAGLFTYPDLSVACEEPAFIEAEDDDTLLNPTLIVEILSPQTEGYDLGRKAEMYRRLSSLRELVMIAQDRAHVVAQRRRPDGGWSLFEADGLEASIELTSIGCSLRLADLYEDVLERIRPSPSASLPC